MNKVNKRIVASIILALLSTECFTYGYDTDSIQNEINSNIDRIEGLKEEQNIVNSEIQLEEEKLQEVQGKISAKQVEVEKAIGEVNLVEKEISDLEIKINSIEDEIFQIENTIKAKETEIENLKEQEVEQNEVIAKRLRAYQKVDMTSQYLYMIFSSKSISEVIDNMQAIFKIMTLDRNIMNEIKKIRKDITVEVEILDEAMAVQIQKKEEVKKEESSLLAIKSELDRLKDKKEAELNELATLEDERLNIINSLKDKNVEIAMEMEQLTIFNEELQNKLDAIFEEINNSTENDEILDQLPPTDTGYLRPVDGPITEYFGGRINPVTGKPGNHNGMDYGASYGSPIWATKSGVVAYSGWLGDYGNIVIIDHGNGVQSYYAHMSEIYATNGQVVSQGETIGLVGSTGMSTGPHLHFEIRINGAAVDPYDYIPY